MQTQDILANELARWEIERHKWIESEKAGRDIGFEAAMEDWVQEHGRSWLQQQRRAKQEDYIFCERRRHRRFPIGLHVRLEHEQMVIQTTTRDINILGFSCRLPVHIPEHSFLGVTLKPCHTENPQEHHVFRYTSRVIKTTPHEYGIDTVIPFNETVRDYFRDQTELFKKYYD